jgi:hypothetical protein
MRGGRTFVALMLALILVLPTLGGAGYGALLHMQVVEPPQAHIRIGRYELLKTRNAFA